LHPIGLKPQCHPFTPEKEFTMKTFRLGLATLAGASLLLSMSACANPTAQGVNVKPSEVGTEIEVAKDDTIAAMVPDDIRQKGSFTAAINPDIAPVKFLDSNGEFAGLSPELLTAAATVMDVDLDLQQGTFDALVPGLEAQRFDVIASIGDFKERQAKIDFIDYLKTGTAIISSAGFEKDKVEPEELCGLRISFVRGTSKQGMISEASDACVAKGEEKVSATGYGDANAALLSVKSEQADGFWGDIQSMVYNAETSPELYKIIWSQVTGPYGIGINKEDTEFRDALQAALLKLVETGAYDQLLEKWGQQDFGMPEMPLNTGRALGK
jgi:polar amino acid transport system substrate-binding protein